VKKLSGRAPSDLLDVVGVDAEATRETLEQVPQPLLVACRVAATRPPKLHRIRAKATEDEIPRPNDRGDVGARDSRSLAAGERFDHEARSWEDLDNPPEIELG
jgi:hypothetical protein